MWYDKGEIYSRVRFKIRAILGAADPKFQLQSRNQAVLNKDYDEIQIRGDRLQQSRKEHGDDKGITREV